jgi:hypothetical protein
LRSLRSSVCCTSCRVNMQASKQERKQLCVSTH